MEEKVEEEPPLNLDVNLEYAVLEEKQGEEPQLVLDVHDKIQ